VVKKSQENSLIILIPVFNDWEAVTALLPLLDEDMKSVEQPTRVVLVDDGSTEPLPKEINTIRFDSIVRLDILSIRRNLGHQRAIAIALSYIQANVPCRAVVIMDGDGEDSPGDIPRLLRKNEEEGERKIIFADRRKRSEGWLFCCFLRVYRLLHLLLTGISIRVGNFSIIPFQLLNRLVVVSDLWNHYAAAVFKARLPFETIPTTRGNRLAGRSRMNFVSLVVHGLSAISVFGERVGVRLLVALSVLTGFVFIGLISIVIIQFSTEIEVPVWITYTTGILFVFLVQIIMLMLVFAFIVLGSRVSPSFIPMRDYIFYVGEIQKMYPADE